jgi:hypothetical protein
MNYIISRMRCPPLNPEKEEQRNRAKLPLEPAGKRQIKKQTKNP